MKRWTKREKLVLLNGLGSQGIATFVRKTGRTRAAVLSQVRRMVGRGGVSRGMWSLRRVEALGYHRDQIRRAQRALRQQWLRTGPQGSYLITDEQVDEMLEWLKHDYWSTKHRLYGCLWCQTNKQPPRGTGLCRACYCQHRRECQSLGLPMTIEGQLAVARRAIKTVDISGPNGKFLERSIEKLKRGVVLARGSLEWLLLLV